MTQVVLHTSHGPITIGLHTDAAPATCRNFLRYLDDGHYDGTLIHRVIADFIVQGGGLTPDFQEKPTRAPIRNEADNGLSHRAGAVAMARGPAPHSATAQFFINLVDNPFLDHRAPTDTGWGYCVFGQVTDGMATVQRIAALPTESRCGHLDVPCQDVLIHHARRLPD